MLKYCSVFLLLIFSCPCFAEVQISDVLSNPAARQAAQDYINTQNPAQDNVNVATEKYTSENRAVNAQKGNAPKKYYDENYNPTLEIKGKISGLEAMFSESVSLEGFSEIKQFGYDIFNKSASNFISPQKNTPVGDNYSIGPGDSFDVTMWGVSEGTFKVTVNPNGEITLPKVGLVSVAGLSYSQLKPFLESQLNRFYQGINLGITFDTIKTIQVYVVGEVKQPGSYPISSLSSAFNALFYAGGPTKQGSLRDVRILRNGKVVARLDLYKFLLKGDNSQDVALRAGDTVFVPLIGGVVAVAGNVKRPAIYEVKGTVDLSDILSLAGEVNPSSYLNRIQIERIVAHQKKIVIDKEISIADAAGNLGIPVQNMDLVKIFPIYAQVNNKIYVKGAVKYPGSYAYKEGIRLLDILNEDALVSYYYFPKIEVTRIISSHSFKIDIYDVDYDKLFKEKDDSSNIYLQPGDVISIFASKKNAEKITVQGEIKRPGEYVVRDGERISSVLERAGGYNDSAFLYGAILTRKNAIDIESENYSKMVGNLELDLLRKQRELSSSFVVKEDIATRQMSFAQTRQIVDFMKSASMKGRVIINLDSIEKLKNSPNDIEIEDGDVLYIPKTPKSVIVLGQVYHQTAVAFDHKKNGRGYVDMAGGATNTANEGDAYVIRANGSVISNRQGVNIYSSKLFPGDTIIIPEKIDTRSIWSVFQDFTHWAYEAVVSAIVLKKILQ
ncbi:SLBB domain-containing protein [Candidatus Saganbacteria bacterium]|nr:SLBB domain-containing protein [Candidatus Saganbacteria bacterium]